VIIHVFKDNRDPEWEYFQGLDENNRNRGVDTLRQFRHTYGVPFHKGVHHDKARVPDVVEAYRGIPEVSIYWAEVQEG
jgi:hypothetical protein